MAFTILVEGKDPKGKKAALEYSWTIEQRKPIPDAKTFWLEASGRELGYIRSNFDNIPITRKDYTDSCEWTGEMACFIFDNL